MTACPLNPEPTVSQLAALERARRTGKTANPTWYRNPAANVKPRVAFVPNRPPVYPHRLFTPITNEPHRDWVFSQFSAKNDDALDYIEQFNAVSRLKPCPIRWVKTVGNYA